MSENSKPDIEARRVSAEHIVARSISIRDDNGMDRITLALHGFPCVQLHDAKGMPRLELQVTPDGSAHVGINSREGNTLIGMGVAETKDGGSGIVINDRRGIPRVMIEVPDDDEPDIEILDADGETVWSTWMLDDDESE
jgi:hypothetical protein